MQGGIPIPEAAAALGISERTVRRRIKDGDLNAYEITTAHGMAWRVVLPPVQGGQGGGSGEADNTSTALATIDNRVDNARLRVVVEELQRTREEVAALRLLAPVYGPHDPGPPVVFTREEIETELQSERVGESAAHGGILAWLRRFFGGEA